MASFDYVQLPKTVAANKTGFKDEVRFAPRSWFTASTGLKARGAGTVVISGDHTFTGTLGDLGWIKAKMSEDSVELMGEIVGDTPDSRNLKLTLKAFRPGMTAQNLQILEEIRNDDFIVLVTDCNGTTLQFGSDCSTVQAFATVESGKKSGGKKGINLEFTCIGDPSIYTGVITDKTV
jgi:hypothetical protein